MREELRVKQGKSKYVGGTNVCTSTKTRFMDWGKWDYVYKCGVEGVIDKEHVRVWKENLVEPVSYGGCAGE